MRTATLLLTLWVAPSAFAGMPAPLPLEPRDAGIRLTDNTVERLQVISFFLLGLLLAAGTVWWLWRVLRKDIPQLPRLSFGGALAGVLLWGLLAVIVLTMISGARELMTPGAWKRNGPTYKLAEPPAPNPEAERMRKIMALRDALKAFADRHGGRYPNADEVSQIPDELWLAPGGKRYEYTPGLRTRSDDHAEPMVKEPEVDSGPRLIFDSHGHIYSIRVEQPKKGGAP